MDLANVPERTLSVCEKEGRYSTAHVYKNALFSFSKFCGTGNISFRQVTGSVYDAMDSIFTGPD